MYGCVDVCDAEATVGWCWATGRGGRARVRADASHLRLDLWGVGDEKRWVLGRARFDLEKPEHCIPQRTCVLRNAKQVSPLS